jgi:tetratricopeptide (TPR) repeat protein
MGNKRSTTPLLAGFFALACCATSSRAMQENGLEAAQHAYEISDYNKAVQILEEARTKNPSDGETQLLLVKSYFELRQYDNAISSAQRAITISPDNSHYHEWLARSLGEKASKTSWISALSMAKRAQQEFETAVRLDGKNYSALQALIEYDCAAPGIAGGGEDKAQPKIAQLAAMDASEGHYAAGNCRRQKKDFAAAEVEFDKALTNAKAPELIFDIGDYALRRDQAERLLAVADAGQKAAPNDARANFYRAAAWIIRRDKTEESERLLREYLRTAPNRTGYPRATVTHDWLGRLFENKHDREAAVREYETSRKLDPKNKTAQEALKRLGKN